ncbi:MAG TPA: 3-isopropylmalate dehydratase [Burkholderiaceae bacterium]|nr:3-isopropylmalate dehydratase [Burkholderiaceae bacterium]
MPLHKVWRVGANIDTDSLAPGAYMKLELKDIAQHALENNYPGLAQAIRPGDVLVAGPNFGIGSSREQAVGVLVSLGVKAVIAPSFSGLYFRNAYNLGLLAIVCADADRIPEGAQVEIDARQAQLRVHEDGREPFVLSCQRLPDFLIDMAEAGGLLNQLQRTYQARIDA